GCKQRPAGTSAQEDRTPDGGVHDAADRHHAVRPGTIFRSGRPASAGLLFYSCNVPGPICYHALNLVQGYPMTQDEKKKRAALAALRSEEHTSELQSREKLVCR